MNIQLSDHFTYKKLLRFTLPSIVMMIFTSIYNVVDGFFVSNFVGKTSFAAVNFIMPFLMILDTVGFMFGTGGSALVAKTLGEGNNDRANRLFSLYVYIAAGTGTVLAILGFLFIRNAASLLGAEGEMLDNCVLYGRVVLIALPAYILQMEFQSFFVTAEKPQLGLAVTVASGLTNMILDALFVAVFKWGLIGAAAATAVSQLIGGAVPVIYFWRVKSGVLHLTKTKYDGRAIIKACTNGSSELMSNISMSLVSMLYNIQLMKYAGEDGVAAYGVIMYINMIFLAAFLGYSVGMASIVGYNYGAENHSELKNLLKKSIVIIEIFAVCMFILSEISANPLSKIFVGYDTDLLELTKRGFLIYSFSFLFSGMSIYGSAFFTALNDGLTSALISFLRTLLFQVMAVLTLPLIWKIDGIWFSIVAAEIMSFVMTVIFLKVKKSKYHY